tara:strand:+ start:169 stop:891 length:723 start_codon:yes stop_codon:yes gene_type:complete
MARLDKEPELIKWTTIILWGDESIGDVVDTLKYWFKIFFVSLVAWYVASFIIRVGFFELKFLEIVTVILAMAGISGAVVGGWLLNLSMLTWVSFKLSGKQKKIFQVVTSAVYPILFWIFISEYREVEPISTIDIIFYSKYFILENAFFFFVCSGFFSLLGGVIGGGIDRDHPVRGFIWVSSLVCFIFFFWVDYAKEDPLDKELNASGKPIIDYFGAIAISYLFVLKEMRKPSTLFPKGKT